MTTALITGASSGIGAALARVAARHGIDMILTATDEAKLREVEQSISPLGVKTSVIVADLADARGVDALASGVKSAGLDIDILINNAGFGDAGLFAEAEPATLERMVQVNVAALTRLTRHFLPPMIERRRGRIMNLASTAAFQPGPLMSVYYASKAYVLSFSEALAEEVRGTGVTVTALCPGPTRSNFFRRARAEDTPVHTLRKPASANDVAEFGFRAMMAGRPVAIHGFLNSLMAHAASVAPRRWANAVVRRLHERNRR